ncbi:MAG: PEP-CTERM sorting domain-containing protein [Armatimonadota bacterium]
MELPVKGHLLAIGVLFLMSVAATAALNEGFETGYGEGVKLSGQNGWTGTSSGDNAVTKADAGRLPSELWGVLANDTNAGGRKAHGLSTTIGNTITISGDVFVPTDSAARIGLTGMGGSGAFTYPYIGVEILTSPNEMWVSFLTSNTNGDWQRIMNFKWNDLAADEWYNVTMNYILGGDATVDVKRYETGNATHREATAAEIANILSPTDITSLDGLFIEGWTGTRFDNIQTVPVPEPASMTLLGLGSLSLLLRRRARSS